MTRIKLIFLTTTFLLLKNISSGQTADLTKFIKQKEVATGLISEIDTLCQILTKKFISIANDTTTKTHKDIQSFYADYKINNDNTIYGIYPTKITKEHLTIQYIDYSNNHSFFGQNSDSIFNTSRLTALILIPTYEIIQHGEQVSTICFKVTLEIYTEGKINSIGYFKREEKITELKMYEIEN